jgi:hypothetical protein
MNEKKKTRKELLQEYKERTITGGVYAFRNAINGKALIQSTGTIDKAKSHLDFSKSTGSCVHPVLANDWTAYGAEAFSLEILETLDKKDTQTNEEFMEDIKALEELWRDKIGKDKLY